MILQQSEVPTDQNLARSQPCKKRYFFKKKKVIVFTQLHVPRGLKEKIVSYMSIHVYNNTCVINTKHVPEYSLTKREWENKGNYYFYGNPHCMPELHRLFSCWRSLHTSVSSFLSNLPSSVSPLAPRMFWYCPFFLLGGVNSPSMLHAASNLNVCTDLKVFSKSISVTLSSSAVSVVHYTDLIFYLLLRFILHISS